MINNKQRKGKVGYKIAEDKGNKGHAFNNLQVEVNLGLKKGYGGFEQEKEEVLNFLTELYKTQIKIDGNYILFVITESIITYAYPKWDEQEVIIAEHEPALVLKSDKSPLYAADMTNDEWKDLVEYTACQLAEKFEQFRVYVSYTTAEVKIFQKV